MSTITPHYRTIQQLLQSQSFSIDEYQREYKWEKKNVDELLDDLLEKFQNFYKPEHETKAVGAYEDYFLGSIIVSKRTDGKNYLIDGQQRVTSLTLLLIYLHHAAKEKQLPVVTSIAPLIYSDNLGVPSFNLDIPERLPIIKALFEGEPFNPEGKDESVQTMHKRYVDIQARDLVGELDQGLPHFIYWLMTKVGLIEIATDNDNYAYAIFETMNDRGKPLSPVDMLKAYLLAPIEHPDKRRLANQTWKQQVLGLITWNEEFDGERDATAIKAWLRAQYAETIRDRKAASTDKDWELIGTTFHRWVRDNTSKLKLNGEESHLAMIQSDFPFFAKAYLLILNASRNYTSGLEAVFYNAQNEFTWQNTVLLASLSITDDPETIRRKISATAIYLDIWLMRRVVNYIRVGYSSTSYTMYLLSKEIRNKPLPELVEILKRKLAEDDVTFDGSPSRNRKGISDLSLNQFTRKYIFHLLARITSFIEYQSKGEDLFSTYVDRNSKNPYDIEHIWANDFILHNSIFDNAGEFDIWRDHIGGLVLLPSEVNRSLQDKKYEDKIGQYSGQNYYAASLSDGILYNHHPRFAEFCKRYQLEFKPYNAFGKQEQLDRRILVEKLVKIIWSPDRIGTN
jgi:uncharacterized protein with ParB-like and HNH nuclease domain